MSSKRITKRIRALVVLFLPAVLVLTGCGFSGLYGAQLPGGANLGSHPYTLKIQFANVLDLVPQSSVKVNDVPVGKVDAVKLTKVKLQSDGTETWMALVTVKVRGDVSLPKNARASVQMTSLLGEKYVSLDQPTQQPDTARLQPGATIGYMNTDSAPEVEQVLGALSLLLNGGGLNQLSTITKELNNALGGHVSDIRDLINQLNSLASNLDRNKDQITTALVNVNTLADTLRTQKSTIVSTLETLPKALNVLNTEKDKLVTLLASLAKLGNVATGVISKSKDDFVATLKNLQPILENLNKAGSTLPSALNVMLTYPFPIGTTENILYGDYANLDLTVNADILTNLCGLLPIPSICPSSLKSSTSSTGATPASSTTSSATPATQLPSLPGAGK